MKRENTLLGSALMLTAVNLMLRFGGTAFQVWLSGRIGAAGIGLLQLILSVNMLALTLGAAGGRTTAMYLTAEALGKKRPADADRLLHGCFRFCIFTAGAVGFCLYLLSPALAQGWIGSGDALPALRTWAAFLPVVCLTGVMTGYFTAAKRIGALAAVEVAEQFFSMGMTVLLLRFWAGNDPSRACQAVIMGSGLGSCFTLTVLLLLKRTDPQGGRQHFGLKKKLLETAVPLAIADDVKAGISTTENLMVPKRLALYPGSTSPLAAFGMVCGMVFPVLMLGTLWKLGLDGIWLNFVGVNILGASLGGILLIRVFKEIKNKMTYIETVWNSPAGTALVEQFQSLNPVFESYVTALDQYALYLQQTAESYQENEQMLTQGIG